MYQDYLKFYPGFPIEGVNFVDVLPFLQDKEVFTAITRDLGALCASPNVVAHSVRPALATRVMLPQNELTPTPRRSVRRGRNASS